MRRSLLCAGFAVTAWVGAATPLAGQGSSVDQQSACMTGRIGAGVASPCDDGSAVYFSPAGLAQQPGVVSVGVTLVRSGSEFAYDAPLAPRVRTVEREEENRLVPQAFLNVRVNPRLAAGIGVFAPYGLGLEWPVCPVSTPRCEGPNFEGRFTGYDNQLRGVYIQPTVAYQLIPGKLSLGAGVDFVRGSIEVHRRIAGPAAFGLGSTDIADATLEGDGNAVTGHVGAILRATDRLSIAARYLHSATVGIDGSAAFVQVPTGVAVIDQQIAGAIPTDQGVETDIEFPSQLVLGASFRPVERLELLLDYQRTGWSSFDRFDIDFASAADDTLRLNYKDTDTYRLGAEFQALDALALRAGFRYNTAATPRATPFLPEGERNYYTLGLGYRVTPQLSADLSYQYIQQPDRQGAVVPEGPRAGIYSATGQTFGLMLAYRFGSDVP